jgi:penicillin-binding protein 2
MAQQGMLPDDRHNLSVRLSVVQYLIAIAFASLAVCFWVFQIAKHAEFRDQADTNFIRRLPLPAPRGVLFDRNGKILVANQNTFNIVLDREQTRDIEQTLQTLAEATGADPVQMKETVRRKRREPSYRPIVLIENATEAQVIAMRARAMEMPGVDYQVVPARNYGGDMAAHLFGYVGEISDRDLQRADYKGLEQGAIIGQAGIEQSYNKLLMGNEGYKAVIVNSHGREIREVERTDPREGSRLMLTIDADLQKAAEDGFRHYGLEYMGKPYNGAAVILDPRNGEVLSLVSVPAYDPNKFAVGIDSATWSALNTDKSLPLQNRALQAIYSPGSTFKIVVATAALEEGVATPDFKVHCSGGAFFYTRVFACHLKGGHGTIDMRHAIEKSCNVYFYTLGKMLGVERIHKWATRLGLGVMNGIDIPNEKTGLMGSEEWKLRVRKEKWYPGDTISLAIGQGYVSVPPLQLAQMIATVANGGTRYTPHVVKAIDKGKGWEPLPTPPPQSVNRFKESTVKALHDGLWLAVNGAGTAGRGRLEGRDVAGKTGTAQPNMSLETQRRLKGKLEARDHGWFVFMAPKDNPEIAGVIFAEHAEHGYYGASIAKHVIATYYAKKEGKPLPTLVKPPATTIIANAPSPTAAPGRPGGAH